MEKPPKYHAFKLPNKEWQTRGEGLILAPQIKHVLQRYGKYRLIYMPRDRARFGCYGLITLNGPPGVGKSDTARWTADTAVREFGTSGHALLINPAGLFDEHLGNSQKLVAALFEDIALAAQRGPTVLIWEDAESLFVSRQHSLGTGDPTDVLRVTSELLAGLDRLRFEPNILMISTCNLSGVLDPAIVSRSDLILTFALPSAEARLAILAPQVQGLAGARVLHTLAAATEGKSGRELSRINLFAYCQGTAKTPEQLTEEDYLAALALTPGDSLSQAAAEPETPMQTEPTEENDRCQSISRNGSSNGFHPAVIAQATKYPWPMDLYAMRRASSSVPSSRSWSTRLSSSTRPWWRFAAPACSRNSRCTCTTSSAASASQ